MGVHISPGNKLPGYFQMSLRERKNPCKLSNPFQSVVQIPGYFQLSLRDKKNP
jgi:hypothetical protein